MIVVLDTSAVLAMMWSEPGYQEVTDAADNSIMSAVNLAEVYAKISDRGVDGLDTRQWLSKLPASIVPFDSRQAQQSGALRALTRHRGLSLGDRACLALAMLENATVITADRSWLELGLDMDIRSIR